MVAGTNFIQYLAEWQKDMKSKGKCFPLVTTRRDIKEQYQKEGVIVWHYSELKHQKKPSGLILDQSFSSPVRQSFVKKYSKHWPSVTIKRVVFDHGFELMEELEV